MPSVQRTQLFCVADPVYYETPERLPDHDTRYGLDRSEPPPGWRRDANGLWTSMRPHGTRPAEQGWKIHVSTVPAEAARTLDDTARICLAHGVIFKFLRSERALALISGKYMARGGSGKFITAYPPDEETFLLVLAELVEALDGRRGPYILSDLRIGRAPVYVRYGAFVERWCRDADGNTVHALRHPSGALVPDTREVVFRTPDWVTPPDELRPHLAARAAAGDDGFPYRVREALQFSNAGGIYLAEHRDTGERVVLREARPHSGLDAAGDDAVTRLHREHRALRRLAGLDCVPKVYGVREVWEHHFLIEEHIEGNSLLEEVVTRHALAHGGRSPAELAAYAAWAEGIADALGKAVASVHERGLRFGDLHPSNVIVRPDGSVVLIDFEYATDLDDPHTPVAGAPGLQAPPGTTGAEVDHHALWATWLNMLMPLLEMAERDPGKVTTIETWARRRFGLGPDAGPPRPVAFRRPPAGSGEQRVRELFGAGAFDWPTVRDLLVAGVHAGATPERRDRLFAGDPAGFDTGGTSAAHGAAGVLYALHRVGARVPEAYVEWLAGAARRNGRAASGGLFDGLPGVAVVLAALGRREDAYELMERAAAAPHGSGADLFSGLAGLALARTRLAVSGDGAPDTRMLDAALRDARELDALVRGDRATGLAAPPSAGLLYGLSGAALLQLRLYELTGEEWLLRAAEAAIDRESGHCVDMPGGSVQVRDGRRHLLYLDQGSSGVALVAREHPARWGIPGQRKFLSDVRRGCVLEFVREPGLFRGRAGLIAAGHRLGGPELRPDVLDSVRNLSWHLVARNGALHVPGAGLRRYSTDLATGSAGVLLALHSVFGTPEPPADGRGRTRGAVGLLDLLTLG
ncbi:class III lanthionine synthetase LanKC [Streptomyces sp. DT171]|uniref:class III lanthionine synthetase LanKC n=1 Tax=Streptomyces sp. DT171 TaxID=3416524 RepID=UPI003CF765EE